MENSSVTITATLPQKSLNDLRYIQMISGETKTNDEIIRIALEHFRKQLQACRMFTL